MGLKALITLDLTDANGEQREKFYDVLKKEKWNKIPILTTAWTASFNDDVNRNKAIITLKAHLQKAKNESKIKKVEYAMQLSIENVEIGSC
ncbi:MAG: hypothetical protein A2033_02430 [Bacteroidetes bacterium GWA2_31_9]|nr:MAG: hypothetical protein A2033_02430 [Bacteroidetes bacterium GWA2_31_9]